MRHGKKFNHLSRKSAHRKAMLANMAASLIMHKRIRTTLAKAKALRGYVEPLITKSKDDSTHSRRTVFSYLQSKEAVTELFREVAVKIADRPGGYTRILKTGNRLGDNAEMCYIELVDYNENLLVEKAPKAKASTRRRGGKKSATPSLAAANVVEAEVVDTVKEVKEEVSVSQEIAETPAEDTIEEPKAEEAEESAEEEQK
ncbi:MAG: 50S ribosomal protein L17 [Bacteroidetes bacterium]|nr:50S ribosomal protein L17 [Bacteroidota bacterium]